MPVASNVVPGFIKFFILLLKPECKIDVQPAIGSAPPAKAPVIYI